MVNVDSEVIINNIVKLATDDSRDIHEMRKTSKMRGKKGMREMTWKLSIDVAQFNYSLVQLFYPLLHEKIPLPQA